MLITPRIAKDALQGLEETHNVTLGVQKITEFLRGIANSDEPVAALLLTERELWVLNARRDPGCPEASKSAKRKLEEATEAFALTLVP